MVPTTVNWARAVVAGKHLEKSHHLRAPGQGIKLVFSLLLFQGRSSTDLKSGGFTRERLSVWQKQTEAFVARC